MRFPISISLIILIAFLAGIVSCNDGGDSSGGGGNVQAAKSPAAADGAGDPVSTEGGDSCCPPDADNDGVSEVVTGDSDWPAGVPRYPGSEVVYSKADPSGESWGALQSTTDDKDKVLKFYRDNLEANGFVYRSRNEVDGATVDHYDHDKMTVNVGWEENEHGRAITLLVMGYSMKGAFDDDGDAGSDAGDGDGGDDPEKDGGDTGEYTLSNTLTGFARKALKPYPGAEVTQEITDGPESAMMQSIKADGDEIMDFYEKHWKSLGFERTDNIDMGEMRMIAFSGPAGEVSCTLINTGDGYMATNVFTVGEGGGGEDGDDTGSGEGRSGSNDSEDGEFVVKTGDLPDGWPVDVLPQYKGSKIESSAINGDEYTLLQRSTDADNLVVKFYDKHFREAGFKKVTSQTVMDRYIGGWEKDGWQIDMTCSKDDSGGSFTSLCYYK